MGWPRTTSSFPEPTWWNGDPRPEDDRDDEFDEDVDDDEERQP